MNIFQKNFIVFYCLLSFIFFLKGYREAVIKKNPYGRAPYLFWLGIFVWGDALIFALFWFVSSLISLILKDWLLFWLLISSFWLVRSLGETIYWLNEQFATIKRNPPETLIGHFLLKNDSIWFIYQIFWQCFTVVSLVATIFLAYNWLKKF